MKVVIEPNNKYDIAIEKCGRYRIEVKADKRVVIDLGTNKVASNYGVISVEKSFSGGGTISVINETNMVMNAEINVELIEECPPPEETPPEETQPTTEQGGGA